MTGVRGVGDQVEDLLAALRSRHGDPAQLADQLVRLLVGLYGDGLAHIAAILAAHGQAGAEIMTALTEDPLVESLLLLHDLHPLDVDARVQRALDQVRPYLGSHAGGVRYLGVADGLATLRLEGNCHGCPSSTVTVKMAIEGAIMNAAPEVTEVVVEGMTAPPEPGLLQIGRRPGLAGGDRPGGELSGGQLSGGERAGEAQSSADGWVTLPPLGPPSARPVAVPAAGITVLVCAVRGTLYAYKDVCPACGSSLADGSLQREELTCPSCDHRYNVRLAGQGIDDPAAHLDPLPLLSDSLGVRIAVPMTSGLSA